MKREGRQHGMVRTHRILPSQFNPRPRSKLVNRVEQPPTAGLFTKVRSKPTNHSKYTGKCGKARCAECHMQPCCKSKDKTKGTRKVKSHDVVSNCRLVTWRVVDGRPGLNFTGFSATGMLEHLANEFLDDDDDDDEEEEEVGDDGVYDCDRDQCGHDGGHGDEIQEAMNDGHGEIDCGDRHDHVYTGDDVEDGDGFHDEDKDDGMSFHDVGFALDGVVVIEDEDWCLVAAQT